MENLNAEQIKKALENWAKNFDGKATEFVIICSARRIIDYLSKENERLNETCEKLADTLENIEDHCKTYMKDYFKCRYAEHEAECKKWQSRLKIECEYTRADTVRKMQERLKALIKSDYINGTREQAMSAIDQIANELLKEDV